MIIGPRIEARVETAIGIEPADMVACGRACASTSQGGESAPDQNLAIRLHREGGDIAIGPRIEAVSRLPSALSRPIWLRVVVPVPPPPRVVKVAPDQNLAIRLHRKGARQSYWPPD